jgi:hypothetical protein
MKTRTLQLLTLAAATVSLAAINAPALAHDGHAFGRDNRIRHFGHPGAHVVYVRPPVRIPLVVYRPAPAYYAPAPVYYPAPAYYAPAPVYYSQPAWGVIGGAIAGAAIGSAIGEGRAGAIAAGSVIGAAVGGNFVR